MEKLRQATELALRFLREQGAELADVEITRSETRELNVEGGALTLLRTLYDNSMELTAVRGGKRGSLQINRLDEASIRAAAADCMAVAEAGLEDAAWDMAPASPAQHFVTGAPEPEPERLLLRTQELVDEIRRRYPKVLIEQLITEHRRTLSLYRSSTGVEFSHLDGGYTVGLDYSGHEGEDASSFFFTEFTTDSLERPFLDCCGMADELEKAENSIHTQTMEGSFVGDVLLHPDCLAGFLSTAAALFCGDGSLIDGTSLWKDKLGERVADPRLNLSFAPHDPRILGGERYTEEGFPAEDYVWIENGVLRSFCLSLYGANKTGLPRAANGDGCLVMQPGRKTVSELIAGIDRGLMVGRFSGGDPSINGDFSGVAKNSFRIEGGKLGAAVSETMIAGNLAALLQNVAGVSAELICDGANVLPWVAFHGVTISGT